MIMLLIISVLNPVVLSMEEAQALRLFAQNVGKVLAENNDIAVIDKIARARSVAEFRRAIFELLRSVFTYLNKKEDGKKRVLEFIRDGMPEPVRLEIFIREIVGEEVENLEKKIQEEGFSYYLASLLLAKMLDEINRANAEKNTSGG